jgi:hypothetical protein
MIQRFQFSTVTIMTPAPHQPIILSNSFFRDKKCP